MQEHFFHCPYCWQNISMLVDTSVANQNYVEDCEVCCNPIKIQLNIVGNEIGEFQALRLD